MHHSDKSIPYCCDAYIKILKQHDIAVIITSKYDPYENAIAERINGTIKNEFAPDKPLPDKDYASREIAKTIRIYNNLRPHLSCGMQTPAYFHQHNHPIPEKQTAILPGTNYFRILSIIKKCQLFQDVTKQSNYEIQQN